MEKLVPFTTDNCFVTSMKDFFEKKGTREILEFIGNLKKKISH